MPSRWSRATADQNGQRRLGTQWYILFNVIPGALAIPSEFEEVGSVFAFSRSQQWRTIILPGIFPYLVTGLITASGGAWNASIVAEYFHLKGQIYATLGLGAQISAATQDDLACVSRVVEPAEWPRSRHRLRLPSRTYFTPSSRFSCESACITRSVQVGIRLQHANRCAGKANGPGAGTTGVIRATLLRLDSKVQNVG